MSITAFGIMLKPILSKYLEPLEENGTIAKLQRDITLIAESNAIPELATLVSELQEHNRLMRRLFEFIEQGDADYESPTLDDFGNVEPGANPGATGFDGDNRNRLSELSRPD